VHGELARPRARRCRRASGAAGDTYHRASHDQVNANGTVTLRQGGSQPEYPADVPAKDPAHDTRMRVHHVLDVLRHHMERATVRATVRATGIEPA